MTLARRLFLVAATALAMGAVGLAIDLEFELSAMFFVIGGACLAFSLIERRRSRSAQPVAPAAEAPDAV